MYISIRCNNFGIFQFRIAKRNLAPFCDIYLSSVSRWSDTSIVRHWPRSPLFPRFSELEDRSHRIVRPFSLSHAGYPRSRASYTRITWRGSRPRVRWPAALQGRPRAMLPNTTSDDAANAAIIAGPIL